MEFEKGPGLDVDVAHQLLAELREVFCVVAFLEDVVAQVLLFVLGVHHTKELPDYINN